MAGGKGKSTGGKAGPNAKQGKQSTTHSARAGLQVSHSFVPFSTVPKRVLHFRSSVKCDAPRASPYFGPTAHVP